MKNCIIFLIAFMVISAVSMAEKRYVVKKIHTDGSRYYDLNNKGEVAFVGSDPQGKIHIYLYSGGLLKQITTTLPYSYYYYSLDLNDNSQIVWTMFSKENTSSDKYMLMFYDGASISKIQDNLYWNYEIAARINNSGTVVWHGIPGFGWQPEIYMASGTTKNVSNSSANPDLWPMLNKNGMIAWFGDNRNENDWSNRIRYIKPGETTVNSVPQGTNAGSSFPFVDDNNDIIFNRANQGAYDLCLFNGTNVTTIDDSIYIEGNLSYKINSGNVVYSKGKSGSYSIYLYSKSGISKLSLPGTDNYHPSVNSTGLATWRTSKNEVYARIENVSLKIGTDGALPPLINNDGIIVWAGSSIGLYGNDIYIAEYKEVYDVAGRIVGPDNTGLAGVAILVDGTVVSNTDASGNFSLTNLNPGQAKFSFSKSGYLFTPENITLNLTQNVQISPDIVARITTGMEPDIIANGISLYPNPASNKLNIAIANPELKVSEVIITDITGRNVKKILRNGKDTNDQLTIEADVSTFKQGLYFCSFSHSKGSFCRMFAVVR